MAACNNLWDGLRRMWVDKKKKKIWVAFIYQERSDKVQKDSNKQQQEYLLMLPFYSKKEVYTEFTVLNNPPRQTFKHPNVWFVPIASYLLFE